MENWGLWVHSFKTLLPKEQYFASHPEYFALVNGKRTPDQPDLTNPEVLKIVTANLKRLMDSNPSAKYWSVSQNDNSNYCQCPNCKKLDDEQGSHQGSLLTFVNAVAKQFPNRIITTLAYNYSLAPPKNLRPEKNVMIVVATSNDRHIPIAKTPNSSFNIYFKKWTTLTNNIFVWDYISQFGNALSPFPNINALKPNIKFFANNNVHYVFEEGIGNLAGEFSELKCYLVAELMWNKEVKADSLAKNFVDEYYGAGGKYIWQYLQLLNRNADASNTAVTAGGSPLNAKNTYLSNTNLDAYETLFRQALNVTDSSTVFAKRIKKEYLGVLRPISAMPATTSYGKECSASCFAATGATTLCAKSRTVLANCWYSSGSVPVDRKSVMILNFRRNSGQRLAHLDLIAGRDEKFDDTVDRRRERVLHLHRLDGDNDRARFDRRAVVDADRDHGARHRAGQFRVPAVRLVFAD